MSFIDLALISDLSRLLSCSVLPPLGRFDHNGRQLSLKWRISNPVRMKRRKIWRYNLADFETANSIPQATLSDKCNLPWLNVELTKSMQARNLAYKCAKWSHKLNNWYTCRMKRNEIANKLYIEGVQLYIEIRDGDPLLHKPVMLVDTLLIDHSQL